MRGILELILRLFSLVFFYLIELFFVCIIFFAAIISRLLGSSVNAPRIVWGSTPLMNISHWSNALKELGYKSETYTTHFYSINKRSDWDILLTERFKFIPESIKPFFAFIESLFRYDIFFTSCDGFFIGKSHFKSLQAIFLKIALKKIIVIPYGSDSYVYSRIRSTGLIHGLMMSYPGASKEQQRIAENVDYWTKYADVVIPGWMGPDGFGRWDVLTPSVLCLDLNSWQSKIMKNNNADGRNGTVRIAHAPNHRGFKGTEFVIEAVELLKKEGLLVELILIEGMKNTEVKKCLQFDADILVEQLIFTGHGLNGLEGLACGLPVISNLEDESYVLPFRRWSFFNECPIVSASPEIITEVLRKLVTNPSLRSELGTAGRKYAEKYHGYDSTQYLVGEIINFLLGKRDSLINLYHPLLGEYSINKELIQHPLVNNKIID